MARKRKIAGGATGIEVYTTTPRRQRSFGVPQAGSVRRAYAATQVSLPHPDIELPPNEDEQLVTRWQAWQEGEGGTAGSILEFICWDWLVRRRLQPHVDFIYQYNILGGRTLFGGFVVDFYFPRLDLVWLVQGLHFHYTDPKDRARDQMAVALLSSRGMKVVQVYEDDLLTRPGITLEKAYRGEQVSRAVA